MVSTQEKTDPDSIDTTTAVLEDWLLLGSGVEMGLAQVPNMDQHGLVGWQIVSPCK